MAKRKMSCSALRMQWGPWISMAAKGRSTYAIDAELYEMVTRNAEPDWGFIEEPEGELNFEALTL
jgi:hypothetical protein